MLLRNLFSPSPSSLSSSTLPGSEQNPSCEPRSLIFSLNSPASFSLHLNRHRSGRGLLRPRYALLPFRASTGNVSPGPNIRGDEDNDQYLQASLLVPEISNLQSLFRITCWIQLLFTSNIVETVKHYNLWKEGFVENTTGHSASKKYPFSSHRIVQFNDHSIGHGFLQRFQSPTVFLKIACDGDLLLPIIVGEFAIVRLIDAITGEEIEECPDQFQFVYNIVRTFGYEVKMVRITDRVVNTYYARIYLKKAADNTNISIDARPSDALNVAERFKAPIYVSKDIVVKDAIKVVYGNWRARSTKVVYDVSLDSAPDEADPLFEELDLVHKMNAAILEERFEDAAVWRDQIAKLRMPRHEI